MRVVCNTSPLLFLAKIERLSLLSQLYTDVMIPRGVLAEIRAKPDREATQIQALLERRIFQLVQPPPLAVALWPADLGLGEREALALAADMPADRWNYPLPRGIRPV